MYVPLVHCTNADLEAYQSDVLKMLPENDLWLHDYARAEFARASSFIDRLLAVLFVRILSGERVSRDLLPEKLSMDAEVQATVLVYHLVQALATGKDKREDYLVSVFSIRLLYDCLTAPVPGESNEDFLTAMVLGTMMANFILLASTLSEPLQCKDAELQARIDDIVFEGKMRCWWLPNHGNFWELKA